MIEHIGFSVSDYEKAKAFYEKLLGALGYVLVMEATGEQSISGGRAAGFGPQGRAVFWISEENIPSERLHIALSASSRAMVDAFHAAGLAAGGKDNGAPGVRAQYSADYYAAFVLDLDGNNIEAVYHGGA